MNFDHSELDFSKVAISLYSPDHITYLNQQPPLENKGTCHYALDNTFTTKNSPSYGLEEILSNYQSQPDLLQLILESKIQQDRRRTEEAQLQAKELDFFLLQHRLANVSNQSRQHSLCFDSNNDLENPLFCQQVPTSPPSPLKHSKSRKRREMQAITKLVETKDHNYEDGHLWRNNGNTIQKKTGNKSVYFKCANSIKGCTVNKTSTYNQKTGEYIIKYRGEHLLECSQVKHIVQ